MYPSDTYSKAQQTFDTSDMAVYSFGRVDGVGTPTHADRGGAFDIAARQFPMRFTTR